MPRRRKPSGAKIGRQKGCKKGRIGTPGYGRAIQRAKENIAKDDEDFVDEKGKPVIRVAVGSKSGKFGKGKKAFASSNVDYIAYNRETRQLDVGFVPDPGSRRFRRGAAYRLPMVTPQRVSAFIRSASKGKYFWRVFRDPGKKCRKGWVPQRRIR